MIRSEFACKGISERVNASDAGDKSSVFVSPGTLYTVTVISSGIGAFAVNHSALAHEVITLVAAAFPSLCSFSTSLNASYTRSVLFKASTAASTTPAFDEAKA